ATPETDEVMIMRKRNPMPVRHGPSSPAPRPAEFETHLPEAERLVGLGFRYWMLGRARGEVECWERAWCLYSGMLGVAGARMAVDQLASWVRALDNATHRKIELCAKDCRGFCRDECVAVSMIAACQHNTCPAMRACAFALAESAMLEDVVQEAQAFADTMMSLDQVLSPGSILPALATVTPATSSLQ
ncbi:MAG: hypothetical protein ACK5JT_13630, partial [Hyphomicrobiaceae bacterium]